KRDSAPQLISSREVRLGIAVEANAAGAEPLEVHDGWHHALPAEPVQCPEQHAIEFALVGVLEQSGKLLALFAALPAALAINVLPRDLVPSLRAPIAELAQLIFR